MILSTEFRVYVGTYGKYAAGSIDGQWLDLSEFADHEDFHAKCLEIHADESDPEFMFQDHEGVPGQFISESWISPEVWEWIGLDDYERQIIVAYLALTSYTIAELDGLERAKEQALDLYQGKYDSEAEAAEEISSEDIPDDFPTWIRIDWESTWGCSLCYDYISGVINGELWVFNNR